MIHITRDGKLHVGGGTGPMPSEAEIIAAVRDESSARLAQANETRAAAVLIRVGKFIK